MILISNEIQESVRLNVTSKLFIRRKLCGRTHSAFDELNLLDNYATTLADQSLRFQKLVVLQQNYDLFKKVLSTQCFCASKIFPPIIL